MDTGQLIDGQYSDGALNVGLGSLAIFGGVAGQNAIKKTDTGISSPANMMSSQENSRSSGKNIFPVDMSIIVPGNVKYVDIISQEERHHILYGESLKSGGHIYPGNSGKTVYPLTWSANKIFHEIEDIATSLDTKWFAQTGTGGMYTSKGDPEKWIAYQVRDGVRIRVIYQPATGKVVTAFPDNTLMPTYKPLKN
ncbi:EndoU domain-containing protein [Cronobacter muytjensii]|nr:EndoU domain-containing protein [Cronobacter muytjensii]